MVGIMFQMFFVTIIRFSYRFVLLMRVNNNRQKEDLDHIMIIGAGNAGQSIVRDIKRSTRMNSEVMCIIDDNSNKWGRYIEGIPVVGGRDAILENVSKYNINKIYIAIPSASAEKRRDIINICKETDCELKNLPGMYQFINGEVTVANMKEVAIEDLLGREQIKVDMTEIFDYISGKTILVTGGGGSIGSELCRQIANHHPKTLVIFDIYENNAYDIQNELLRKYPKLNLHVLIGSVRDSRRVNQVFAEYRPDIVFHAAAHKHVPLMEISPCEAIKNNTIGTYKVAYAAMMYGTQRFVLISTDKAVNPTNIMGASKRLCELVVQAFDKKIKANRECDIPVLYVHNEDEDGAMYPLNPNGETRLDDAGNPIFTIPGQDGLGHRKAQTEFVAVRFGNVLGSNGSVIPLFKKQIEAGGPVTVTHPDIIRYFMTIPEAVSLVLQAAAYAKGGEIFVLDMGEPVKILDLAENLIKLSGYRVGEDIEIKFTGLRPGEKMYEELLMAEEGLKETANKLIHIGMPIEFDRDEFINKLPKLKEMCEHNPEKVKEEVKSIVKTYNFGE
jgi:FlaA1/EpsC-like NDP-sugar epimerase